MGLAVVALIAALAIKEGRDTSRGDGCCATTPIGADADRVCREDCCT
jgi:hypothetical protein